MIQKGALILSVMAIIFACLAWAANVKVSDGTPVPLRLKAELSSSRAEIGQRVDFTVAHTVNVGGVVAIPEGSVAWGAVQSVKRDKEIKFDIVGLRLPNLREIKLRSVRQKTSNPGKDQIKLETRLGDTVGAAVGTEFTAYVDEDVDVEAAGASAGVPPSFSAAGSRLAEVKPAAQAPVQSVASPAVPTPQSAPSQSAPAPTVTPVSRPSAPPSVPVTTIQQTQPPAPTPRVTPTTQTAAPAAQEAGEAVERVTVECFSDPSGADIVLDDEYYGNTPSILKLLPAMRRLEFKLQGYKTYSQTLDLTQGGAFRTVRGSLVEKKE